MLIYRFRISSDEADDFVREIEIQPGQTFRDFHNCILESLEFTPPENAFFYITLKKDKERQEISMKSVKKQVKRYDKDLDEIVVETVALKLMKDSKVKNYIEDPHQRMTYEIQGKSNSFGHSCRERIWKWLFARLGSKRSIAFGGICCNC